MACHLVYGTDSLQAQTRKRLRFCTRRPREGVAPMISTKIPTAAALRPRTLSAQGSPSALSMAGDLWRANHNSMTANAPAVVPTALGTPVRTERVGYGATKQGAPPRGEPR
jgi:hypothetical protein